MQSQKHIGSSKNPKNLCLKWPFKTPNSLQYACVITVTQVQLLCNNINRYLCFTITFHSSILLCLRTMESKGSCLFRHVKVRDFTLIAGKQKSLHISTAPTCFASVIIYYKLYTHDLARHENSRDILRAEDRDHISRFESTLSTLRHNRPSSRCRPFEPRKSSTATRRR